MSSCVLPSLGCARRLYIRLHNEAGTTLVASAAGRRHEVPSGGTIDFPYGKELQIERGKELWHYHLERGVHHGEMNRLLQPRGFVGKVLVLVVDREGKLFVRGPSSA